MSGEGGPGRWYQTVMGDRTGSTAALVMVPRDQAIYEAARRPLVRNGWTHPSRHECAKGAWTFAPDGVLDVVDQEIVRVGAGGAQIFAPGRPLTSPVWRSAARERRALVVLVPTDSFPRGDEYKPEEFGARLVELAGQRAVTAALVSVRFDEFTGPWPKGWVQR